MSRDYDLEMDTINRLAKMCWNCDGHVDAEARYCSYCGSDLYQNKECEENITSQKKLSSLYKPPYNPTQTALGVPSFEEDRVSLYEENDDFQYEEEKSKVQKTNTDTGIWPILFLSLGVNLMTLGLLLFFFSDGHKLTLQWNSHYWFIYCILSTPLLAFGWKLLRMSNSFEEEP